MRHKRPAIILFAAGSLLMGAFPAIARQQPAPLPAGQRLDARLAFTAREGTWMQPDISPDGASIVFDLLGDIYRVPVGGGDATAILSGPAYETHPAYSPDGRHIAFISDRSGTINLWVADVDGRNARRVSNETGLNVMAQPAWSADGSRIFVSRMVHSLLGFEIWAFPLAGGDGATAVGERITSAQPAGDDDWDARYNAIGVVAADDDALWYAAKRGDTFIPKPPEAWSIVRRGADGTEQRVVGGSGGAMAPALSRDGALLAYATRDERGTALRLRTMATGEDRRVATLDPDAQEGGYYGGVVPRFRFMPGDDALLLSRGGRLERLSLADGTATPIAFAAPVDMAIRRAPRRDNGEETGPVRVRVIQTPVLSPGGGAVALSALGRLYVTDGKAAPEMLERAGDEAYMPSWSPDGAMLAYIRWTPEDAGAVWTIGADGTSPRRRTSIRAFYSEPVFSPDGRMIAALRASHDDRVAAPTEISPDRPTAIVLIDLTSGKERVVARLVGARSLQWSADGRALDYYGPGGLATIAVTGGTPVTLATITGQSPSQYVGAAVAVDEARLSPDRREILVRHASQLWRVALRQEQAKPAAIDLASQPASARLTTIGADSARWTDKGGILWSTGATLRVLAPGTVADAERAADSRKLAIEVPRAVPAGSVVLRGATLLTMRGGEIIRNGEVIVTGDRIVAVGRAGTLAVPPGAKFIDARGRTIMPGLVDAHAHWWQIRRGVHTREAWPLSLNLAFGVTSGLDVQPFTTDIFAYQDRIDAGISVGPRVFSTGPGIFRNSPLGDDAQVAAVLARYRDHYRTRNVKAYMVGDRSARQRFARMAAEMGMIATTEGASDLPLAMTHFIDGFAGQEHNIPVSPLHGDVIALMAATRTSYTPTFAVLYGGGGVTDAMATRERWQDDPRIRRFMPPAAIAAAGRERRWLPEEAQSYRRFAADAVRIQRAGGLVAMGSHGEMHGLGMHWEMQAYVEGGATPMEALTAATAGSAEAIGRSASIGSIEVGKLADLIILAADPLADIANSRSIERVMKGGAFSPLDPD